MCWNSARRQRGGVLIMSFAIVMVLITVGAALYVFTLGESRAAGVPDTDDRAVLLDREVIGVDDVLAAFHAHGAAHDGAVGAEGDGAHTVDGAGRGQHAGAVTLVQQLHAVVVEEGPQTQQRVTRVERLAHRLGSHDRHPNLLVRLCLN